MITLTPWQMILWIAGLELISIPLIIFTVNAIMIGYFKLKEKHAAELIGGIGKVFETLGNDLTKKIKEENVHDNKASA